MKRKFNVVNVNIYVANSTEINMRKRRGMRRAYNYERFDTQKANKSSFQVG